jgi:hypothetical protein
MRHTGGNVRGSIMQEKTREMEPSGTFQTVSLGCSWVEAAHLYRCAPAFANISPRGVKASSA